MMNTAKPVQLTTRIGKRSLSLAIAAFLGISLAAENGAAAADAPSDKKKSAIEMDVGARDSNVETPFFLINWMTDFDEARNRARAEKKDIFLLFARTDNSFWGLRLDTEILGQPAFGSALSESFVFVLLDYPTSYKQPEAEHKKNAALREIWNVNTFPTVFLADKEGRPYAVTGYRSGTVADYVSYIKTLQGIRVRRDQRFTAMAQAATDSERAVMLSQALREMDENLVLLHYSAEVKQLRKLDPKDSTGLLGDINFSPKLARLRAKVSQLIRVQKDYAGAIEAVDQFIRRNPVDGEHLQKTLFLKLPAYANAEQRDHAAIITLMSNIIAISPETESARTAADVRARARALLATENATKQKPQKTGDSPSK